jgi:hypothetical protein
MKNNRNQNVANANKKIEMLYIQSKQLTENIEDQPQTIGTEGIQQRIAQLAKKRNNLENQRKQINLEIKQINDEIKKWEMDISPDQITMFGDM